MHWQTSRFQIHLGHPRIMGIVNLTPDSFTDGGLYASAHAALQHCEQLLKDGAHILDLGAESSRPGAEPVPAELELARLLPVLTEAVRFGVPISVDTYKPAVMQAALDLGADIINDIWALRWAPAQSEPGSLSARQVVAAHPACGVCLMHMHREPQTMQTAPMVGDAVPQVRAFLTAMADALVGLGVARERIVLDPGIGFGKSVTQNFSLLAQQQALSDSGYPLLAGWSRKSSLAALLPVTTGSAADKAPHPRMVASVVAAVLAVERGASIVRVHDVVETVQALAVLNAIK
jgi:dihydropteroate synthase